MCATIGSSSMISIFFMGWRGLGGRQKFGVLLQKGSDPIKFLDNRTQKLRRRRKVLLAGGKFQAPQHWNDSDHAARRAGACATVSETMEPLRVRLLQGDSQLLNLLC